MAKKEVENEIEPLDGQLKLDSNGEMTELEVAEKKQNKGKKKQSSTESKNSSKSKKSTTKKTDEKKTTDKKTSNKKETKGKKESPKKETETNPTENKPEEKKTETKKTETKKTEKKTSEKKNTEKKTSTKKDKEKDQKEKVEKPEKKIEEKKESPKKETETKPKKTKAEKKVDSSLDINVDEIISESKSVSKKEEKNKALLDEAFAGIEDSLNDFDSLETTLKSKKAEVEKSEEEKPKKKKEEESTKPEEKPKDEKKAESSKPEEKIKVITLPSKGSLKDIKGEEIEDFIEETSEKPDAVPQTRKEKKEEKAQEEEVGIEPAEKLEPAGKNIKPLPRALTHFVPIRGDGIGEILRKGIVDICLVLLIVSMVILVKSTRSASSDESQNGNLITNYAMSYDLNSKTGSMPSNILEKYYSLYNTNNNLVGWLTIHNTQVDLPVLKYTDNSHYATYDYFEKALTGINAYADSKCNMNDLGNVTIIYIAKSSQVNSINGISAYKDSNANLSTIDFGTLYTDMTWKLIACITDQTAINTLLESRSDRTAFDKCVLENNIYEENKESSLKSDDQVLLIQIPDSDGNQIMLVAKRVNEKSTDL